jgi:hypothetical protein
MKLLQLILIISLLFSCSKVDSARLDLEKNLLTFDYNSLKGNKLEKLLSEIVQDSLQFKYIGDEFMVSGISLTYFDRARIFVYFSRIDSIDYFSDVEIEKVNQNEIKRVVVFKGKSASDEVININFEK